MDQEDLERLRAVGNHIKDIADYQSHIIDNVLDEELWENFFGLLVSSWAASSCSILISSVVQGAQALIKPSLLSTPRLCQCYTNCVRV